MCTEETCVSGAKPTGMKMKAFARDLSPHVLHVSNREACNAVRI